MLSFFLKKKQSSDSTHEEIIQGPSDPASNNSGDDFIFVEKKSKGDPMNPTFPPSFSGTPYPMLPYPPQKSQSTAINRNQPAVPYVQDVPFVLAPQLRIKNTSDLMQTQVDGVLALLTRHMSVDGTEDYSFVLERSIQNECY